MPNLSDKPQAPKAEVIPEVSDSARAFIEKFTDEKFAGAKLQIETKGVTYPHQRDDATSRYSGKLEESGIKDPSSVKSIRVTGNRDYITVSYSGLGSSNNYVPLRIIELKAETLPFLHVEINKDKQKYQNK